MIPYLIAFILLGIPLAWVEWTMGRFGGKFSHGSAPGILSAVIGKPWAKYLGSIGIIGPLLISFYYIFVESWLLGFAWYSLNGELLLSVNNGTVGDFFSAFITLKKPIFGNIPSALFFFVLTFIINFGVIGLGIRKGIEKLNKIGLPVIFVLGLVLLFRALTLPGIEKGLAFMWNPDFGYLLKPKVWLEASGQIFFTLSVGIGVILTYASYVRKDQDIALSSITSCAANGFTEVILGGTIIIPMAIVLFGTSNIEAIAKTGTFGLGFNTMPVLLSKMPLASVMQFVWFSLLFFAGVTSSISIIQPAVSFLEDELSYSKKRSVIVTAIFTFIMSILGVFGLEAGAIDELDFWGGTFSLVVFGTFEAILFGWFFGIEKGWEELSHGSHIKIPNVFKFILKYVTPLYLIIILVAWVITDGWKFIALSDVNPMDKVTFIGLSMTKIQFIVSMRLLLVLLLVAINLLIFSSWKRHRNRTGNSTMQRVKELAHE